MNDKVRIYENLRTVSYTPFYLAEARDLYAAEGLEVEIIISPDPGETALGLLAGRVDVSWGGPMRVLLHHDADLACPLVCFCQVVARDPFMLVGGSENPDFRWRDLESLRLGVVSEVPTPWMLLQDDLRRAGIEPDTLSLGPDRTMAENQEALRGGDVDVVQLMEPYAEPLLEAGDGFLWYEGASRGTLAFTTFYTTREFAAQRADACLTLTRALARALSMAYELGADELADIVGHKFPGVSREALTGCIARYQRAQVWSRDTSLPVTDFVRLKAAMLSAGMIANDVAYDRAVDRWLDVTSPSGPSPD